MLPYIVLVLIFGFVMIFSIYILNIPLFLIGFSCMAISTILGEIFGKKKNKKDKSENVEKEEIKSIYPPVKKIVYKYAYNKKTRVFHRLNCSYIRGIDFNDRFCDYMKSDNNYTGLIQLGYKPCKKCKPR
ncbi:MAG: hypothetical protein K2J32_11770 [Ruminococcus sp.]|nr:hypothetical protein [Ruminococcus sp.]